MPLINITLAEGAVAGKHKHHMAAKPTDVIAAFQGSEVFGKERANGCFAHHRVGGF